MIRVALVLTLLPGCCLFCKRPAQKPTPIVIEQDCKLPPPPMLQQMVRIPDEQCHEPALICLDKEGASIVTSNLAKLIQWMKETRRRCLPQIGAKLDEGLKVKPAPKSKTDGS